MGLLKIYDKNESDALAALATGISVSNNHGEFEGGVICDSDDVRYAKVLIFEDNSNPIDISYEWDGGRLEKIEVVS